MTEASVNRPAKSKRPLRTRIAGWARWLHIYTSMLGLAAVLFFSATGITLNHPGWFFANVQSSRSDTGTVDVSWLRKSAPDGLAIVEGLRAAHGIRGRLTGIETDDDECIVLFNGPGYAADVYIDRETGHYTMTETRAGVVAVMNDLHKGRDTGPAWSLVIDITAVFLCVVSATGLLLILYMKKRRRDALLISAAGGGAVLIVYLLLP